MGCSPWGHEELDTTERLRFHFSLSRIGEGKGNPLQCSCLENPRDEGAWWAAIYGVTQSQTRLKRLSSREWKGWFQDDSSTLHLSCASFLLLLHQLHLRSSSFRSQRLGTPAVEELRFEPQDGEKAMWH